MESDTYDAPGWEEAFAADCEAGLPDRRTPVDDEPLSVYRGAGAATIAPIYVEAYLEHLDAGRPFTRERHRRPRSET
jgi:hypothetical protein